MILYYDVSRNAKLEDCWKIELEEDEYDQTFRQVIVDDLYYSRLCFFTTRNFYVFNEKGELIDSFRVEENISFAIEDLK